jgi:hypothetical protein
MNIGVLRGLRRVVRTGAIALVLVVPALFVGSGTAYASTSQCANLPVPSGDGVIAVGNTAACDASDGDNSTNTETITPLINGLSICSGHGLLPTGWVVTAIGNSNNCGVAGEYGNQYVVTSALANGLAICSQTTRIPTGWVATATYNSNNCDVYNSEGNSDSISLPANDMVICTPPSAIPTGWHVISTFTSTYCDSYGVAGGASEIYS